MGVLAGLGVCSLAVGDYPGRCSWCGAELTGRRRRWCSDDHMMAFARNHAWGFARDAALARDGKACVRCGATDGIGPDGLWRSVRLEVNHIDPRNGRGYGPGCHHHQANLETLCRACHVVTTKDQRRARGAA